MHRPVSPLLHDYKPTAVPKANKSKALWWFAVGLGIPLVGVAMFSVLGTSNPQPQAPIEPTLSASVEPDSDIAQLLIEQPEVLVPAESEPTYDQLKLVISRGDTLDGLFRKHDLNLGHLAMVSRLEAAKKQFRNLKPGDEFDIQHEDGKLVSMYSKLDLTSGLKIERRESGFTAEIVEHPIEIRKRMAHAVIDTSLFEAGAAAGLSDRVIMNVAGIFAWDVDFVLDIRVGDNFYVQYEEIWQDEEYVTDGEIIAAEFNNNGRKNQAIRFIDDSGRSDYFTPDGHSVRKAFIRAPVDFSRISSNFNPRRKHPILNTIRAHRGVDYSAPRGTPIKAAGDGKVIFRGVKSGYGNVVILQHGGNITTLYAHMSRFGSGAHVGARVRQGQTIGYVGATGLATANHLHYEYRLNGVHRNPRTVELPKAAPIDDVYRDRFFTLVEPILEELEDFKSSRPATVAFADQ